MRRTHKLVEARADFKETYNAVCSPGDYWRENFQDVLGDAAVPGWSLKREEKVVDVIMELVGAGIMPSGSVGLLHFAESASRPHPHPSFPSR